MSVGGQAAQGRIFPSYPDLRLTNLTVWDTGKTVDMLLSGSKGAGGDRVPAGEQNGPVAIDCTGLTVAPGFRDPHVHFRDPGQTDKETMSSGSAAAAHGGYTGVLIMPNTVPALDGAHIDGGFRGYSSVLDYLNDYEIANSCILPVKYALCAAASRGREGTEASDPEDWQHGLRFPAHPVIAVSDDGASVPERILPQVLAAAARSNIIFIDHCEHHDSGVINDGSVSARLGLPGVPASTESDIVARDVAFARRTGVHVHLQHVSTAASFDIIRRAKAEGIRITCETAPHYCALNDTAVELYGTYAKMNPPLRSEADRQAVLAAIADGTVDMLATDHAPHTEAEKGRGLMEAPNGIIGLETAYAVAHTVLVDGDIISEARLIELMAVNPAHLMGDAVFDISAHAAAGRSVRSLGSERKSDAGSPSCPGNGNPVVDLRGMRHHRDYVWGRGGSTSDGTPDTAAADLVILDTKRPWTIDSSAFLSRARNTPFNGWNVTGRPAATVLDGQLSLAGLIGDIGQDSERL